MTDLKRELKLYELMRSMLAKMVSEIPESDFHRIPRGGGNSPNWILGHLTAANLMGLASLKERPKGLKKLLQIYGPGTTPTEDKTELVSKDELVNLFGESADLFADSASKATSAQLDSERDNPILREQLPTVADIVGHLLTTHMGLHIGQLSAWRRCQGMGPVLKF